MTFIARNSNWLDDRVYSNSFTPQSSNVEFLSDAQVIILPEYHNCVNDMERNAWIINRMFREGDVVLVERPRAARLAPDAQTEYVALTITKLGWDSHEADAAINEAKQPFYELKTQVLEALSQGRAVHHLIDGALRQAPQYQDIENTVRRFLSMPRLLSPAALSLLAIRHIEIQHEKHGNLGRVLRETFRVRQQSLIQAIEESITEENRVFVVCGAAHAVTSAVPDHLRESFYPEIQTFHDYLQEKDYVIFNNDQTPTEMLHWDVKACLSLFNFEKTINTICEYVPRIIFYLLGALTFPVSLPCMWLLHGRKY